MKSKKFLLRVVRSIAFLGIMGIFILPGEGHAETSVFSEALDTLYVTFLNARAIVYVTAGFGLIGVAVAAISGKLPWKWLSMIAVALFTLAAAEKIVLYISGVGSETGVTSDFSNEVGYSEFRINTGDSNSSFDFNDLKGNEDTGFRSYLGGS